MTKRIEALVPVILAKTEEGKIPWKAETATLFVADLGNGHSITVWEESDNKWTLDLRTEDGVRLDGISSRIGFDLAGDTSEKVEKIYKLARRQALDIDAAIDDVERSLLRM